MGPEQWQKITVTDKTQTSGKTLIIVTENIKIHKNLNSY